MASQPPVPPHSGNLRRGRRMVDPGTWFITKCLDPRRALLAGDLGKVIADALAFHADRGDVVLGALCAMPDHWHALLSPVRPRALPAFMRDLDHWVSSQGGSGLANGGSRWQDGYQDTRIRSTRQFHFMRGYIHGNPVDKGLVPCPGDWPWSTACPAYARCATIPWPWPFEQDGLTDEGVPW